MTGWKYVFASVAGTSHSKQGRPCQDSASCSLITGTGGQAALVAVASDGAGSARRAEAGSALVCSLFVEEIRLLFEGGGGARQITREFVEGWVKRFQNLITLRAGAEGLQPRDFASTFLATVIGSDCAVFTQIGDGAIVISSVEEDDQFRCVFWPQQGQYANTTYFLTDEDAAGRLDYGMSDRPINELALFTDGLQGLALHYQTRSAHAPFFLPIFSWLRPISGGYSEKLSSSLASFLDSKKVNERTDDDKTLILATRRT